VKAVQQLLPCIVVCSYLDMCADVRVLGVATQLCGGGYVLDLQLPGGPPHVVLLSLLVLLTNLRERSSTLLTPTDSGSAKVLLRLPVQVRQTLDSCSWQPDVAG
jgi:hypothetical protein